MTIGEICTRDTVITTRDTTVAAAAQLMRQHHVGTLVVVDQVNGGKRVPVGIVTDRDAVVEVMATGLDPKTITVGDIMEQELVTARENEGLTALSCESRAEVDELVRRAVSSGGAEAMPPQDHGFMYGRSFYDPDGHHWEVLWMDPAAAQGEAPAGA